MNPNLISEHKSDSRERDTSWGKYVFKLRFIIPTGGSRRLENKWPLLEEEQSQHHKCLPTVMAQTLSRKSLAVYMIPSYFCLCSSYLE